MKKDKATFWKAIGLLCLCSFSIGISYSQEDHQRITGAYQIPNNNGNNPIIGCGCNSPGLLNYEDVNGTFHTLMLCFDTEPGSFYEIFNEEGITVEGNMRTVTCDDSELHQVLFVEKSEMEVLNRRELIPEFIKKQPRPATKGN